jgi:ferritin-like metal-binding protein YciE
MSTINQETLKDYTADLLSLEQHLLNAVKKQKGSSKVDDNRASEFFHNIDKVITEHVNHLGQILDRLGAETKSEIKTKIASFTGSVAGLIDSVRDDVTSKMIRDDYTALSMVAISYTMLNTVARAAEDEELVNVTEEHLGHITQLITSTSRVIPFVVSGELLDDSTKAEEIAKASLEATQEKWEGEHIEDAPELV